MTKTEPVTGLVATEDPAFRAQVEGLKQITDVINAGIAAQKAAEDARTDAASKDTILVFEANGTVRHRFCTRAEGMEHLQQAADTHSGGAMFTTDGTPAEMAFSLFTGVREKVEEAKLKLRNDIVVRDTLDRNDVPRDRAIRDGVYKAIAELRTSALLTRC